MAGTDHLWMRYLPGLAAAAGGGALLGLAPRGRRIAFAGLATLLGLTCMEAEYWVAHGFPQSELGFFVVAVAITLAAIGLGKVGGLLLGLAGLAFFAYVNIRYGAPYLLDYILPVFYATLLAWSRKDLNCYRTGWLEVGRIEALWLLVVNAITVWRTTALDKWGWIAGRPW